MDFSLNWVLTGQVTLEKLLFWGSSFFSVKVGAMLPSGPPRRLLYGQ